MTENRAEWTIEAGAATDIAATCSPCTRFSPRRRLRDRHGARTTPIKATTSPVDLHQRRRRLDQRLREGDPAAASWSRSSRTRLRPDAALSREA